MILLSKDYGVPRLVAEFLLSIKVFENLKYHYIFFKKKLYLIFQKKKIIMYV